MSFACNLHAAFLLSACAEIAAAQLVLDATMLAQEDHTYDSSRQSFCRQCTTGAQEEEGICSQLQHQCATDGQAGASNFLCTA